METTEKKETGIEKKISDLLAVDKNKNKTSDWIHLYELLREAKEKRLYWPNYRSFTGFVKALAKNNQLHVSSLWRTYKAGNILNNYSPQTEPKDTLLKRCQGLTIETLILLDKIVKNTEKTKKDEVKDQLLGRLRRGNLSRENLADAYKVIQSESRKARQQRQQPRRPQADAAPMEEAGQHAGVEELAVAITTALKDSAWLFPKENRYSYFQSRAENPHYRLFMDLKIVSPYDEKPLTLDALAAENQSGDGRHDLVLHGIKIVTQPEELKDVSDADIYMRLVNRFYLAVLENMRDMALKEAWPEWGILVIDPVLCIATRIREAQPLHPDKRERTLEAVALQLI